MEFLNDLTFRTYAVLTIVSIYNFLLFAGWGLYAWRKERRKMSSVFWAITGLFFTFILFAAANAYIRYFRFKSLEEYLDLMNGLVWSVRHVPCIIVLVGIGFFMTRRVFRSYFFRVEQNRRVYGRRGSDIVDG